MVCSAQGSPSRGHSSKQYWIWNQGAYLALPFSGCFLAWPFSVCFLALSLSGCFLAWPYYHISFQVFVLLRYTPIWSVAGSNQIGFQRYKHVSSQVWSISFVYSPAPPRPRPLQVMLLRTKEWQRLSSLLLYFILFSTPRHSRHIVPIDCHKKFEQLCESFFAWIFKSSIYWNAAWLTKRG